MTAHHRRGWVIVLEEKQEMSECPAQMERTVLIGQQSDLSSEEAGDPVPQVGLAAAAQVPERRDFTGTAEGVAGPRWTVTVSVAFGPVTHSGVWTCESSRTHTYSWCLSDITVKPHL